MSENAELKKIIESLESKIPTGTQYANAFKFINGNDAKKFGLDAEKMIVARGAHEC